jgi:hypothetical protein
MSIAVLQLCPVHGALLQVKGASALLVCLITDTARICVFTADRYILYMVSTGKAAMN